MRVPCYCGHYCLNPENATYVKEGKPLCHTITCERANRRAPELAQQAAELRRIEEAARAIA